MQTKLFGIFCMLIYVSSLPTDRTNELHRRKINSIMSGVKLPFSSCSVCKGIVGFLHGIASENIGEGELIKVAKYICLKAHIETDRICETVVHEFANEVWNVFYRAFLQPNEICGWILGNSCIHFNYYFPSWNVTIPERREIAADIVSDVNDIQENGTPIKVIQVSDTHLDNDYMEGSVANCDEPLCCRKEDGKAGKGFISAPKYGYPGHCDSNILMVNSMFEHLVKTHSDVDYIIWTGDVPPHNVWNQTREEQLNAVKQATKLFVKYFPRVKVYPALGNHEGVPVNSFPPPYITGSQSDNWLLDALAEDWSVWLPEDTKETIKKGGYYTALVKKGFRIVSLNMNYGNTGNWWLWIDSVDPAGQLKWLVGVLAKAEADGEKVHILGHIPPDAMLKWFSFNYYKIINRFHKTVAAQFFGHTHHDEIRMFYDMKTFKTPINVAYVGPSVTTYHDLNPGYRVYDVDGDSANASWSVVNHHTYILDLIKTQKTGKALWELEYNAKEVYGLKSLSPVEWNALIYRMLDDDKLFQIYYRAFSKQHDQSTCVSSCKKGYLCSMKTGLRGGFHNFCKFIHEKEYAMYLSWFQETYNKC